jgi:hypothetical protein
MVCQEELSKVKACTATMGSCASCIDEAEEAIFKDSGSPSCEEYSNGMCAAIAENCDCGKCSRDLELVSSRQPIFESLLFSRVYAKISDAP